MACRLDAQYSAVYKKRLERFALPFAKALKTKDILQNLIKGVHRTLSRFYRKN